jgi:tRNA/rRNA methyltransferase/tRNA (cytidine32/uridine32-2'-O)-methyltransferase
MLLSDVIIVLSRPAEAGNVGAVCRAMKNMGLSRLRLAAPEFSISDVEAKEASSAGPVLSEAGFGYGGNQAILRARAIHAADLWEKAETFDTLAAAVKDCSLVVGTTRRRGRHRKQITMTPAEIAAFLRDRPGKAALVFGNERTGLEDDELELCNLASHVPVDEAFPSLNLSHAVQIYAYELFNALSGHSPGEDAVKGQWVPLDQEAIDALARKITGNLKTIGFYKQAGMEERERFFRDVFSRAALTEREGSYFADIIAKAARLVTRNAASFPEDSV